MWPRAASYYILVMKEILNVSITLNQLLLILKHPSFNSKTLQNDLSIFKLSQSLALSNSIQIACLPPSAGFPNKFNVPTYASGWGLMNENDNYIPDILQNVILTIYPPATCNNVGPISSNGQICAGVLAGGKDTCSGDSGIMNYSVCKLPNLKVKF
jgi:trypsin